MGVTWRTMNLTAIVFFLLSCVEIFQFFLADMGWPQEIVSWAGGLGLSKYTFLFALNGVFSGPIDVTDRGRHSDADSADLFPDGAVFGGRPCASREIDRAMH